MRSVIIEPRDADCWPILQAAHDLERAWRCRVRLMSPTEAQLALDTAHEAQSVADHLGKTVWVLLRKAMPEKYKWRGEGTLWEVGAEPGQPTVVKVVRKGLPSNARAFTGLECRVIGLNGGFIRRLCSRQKERVTRWDSRTVEALMKLDVTH